MWEFTSIKGLNWAVSDGRSAHFYSQSHQTGRVCDRFGFDVGQPMENPPIHRFHKNIGLGTVRRIYRYPSLNELSFEYELEGCRFLIEMDGTSSSLLVKFYELGGGSWVRNVLVCGAQQVVLEENRLYELSDHIRTYPADNEAARADLSRAEALRQCIYGNTVRTPSNQLYTPVSRSWVTMMGHMFDMQEDFEGPVIFGWDAAFAAIIAARVNVDIALSNLDVLFEQLEPTGHLRQFRVGKKMNNLTSLPIVSLAVMKVYEAVRDVEILRKYFPLLTKINHWFAENRDQNLDGLLEWGYEKTGRGIVLDSPYAPWYESGLDDNPMWEVEQVDPVRRCFRGSAIDLNAMFCRDCLTLAEMAKLLGYAEQEQIFTARYMRLADRINNYLWDGRRQIYANRSWSGEFSEELSPTSFYPLLAEICYDRRARALMRHIYDVSMFYGPFMLPSISKKSKYFSGDGDYWRGRIWPPMNYLVLEGLKRCDERTYSILKEKSEQLFFGEWRNHGHIHENYCSNTGCGESPHTYYRSCPFYTWGGLLVL